MSAPTSSLRDAADSVAALTEDVFERLDVLAGEVASLDLDEAVRHGRLPLDDVERLEGLAVRTIRSLDLVIGAGMAATAEGAAGRGVMHWWVRRDDDVVTKRHVLNPESDSYYDFSNLRWFTLPASLGTATLVAPYIDSWGTDDLTVTASLPALPVGGGTTAVVAVDLDVRAYVQAVEDVLRTVAPAVLVDGEGRAVGSTEPGIETGVRLAALADWRTTDLEDVPGLGWSVRRLERTTVLPDGH